ncbi:MAG: hypothetical protein ACK559_38960, partial [bacterium]
MLVFHSRVQLRNITRCVEERPLGRIGEKVQHFVGQSLGRFNQGLIELDLVEIEAGIYEIAIVIK